MAGLELPEVPWLYVWCKDNISVENVVHLVSKNQLVDDNSGSMFLQHIHPLFTVLL